MKSGKQPLVYRIEQYVQTEWRQTIHEFTDRKKAKEAFRDIQERVPRGWYRLIKFQIIATVTP